MTKAKTHQSELERLATLEQQAEMGGGQKAVDRHHERGKLTARERLDLLFDPGSFVEINKLAESQSRDFGMQEKKAPGDGVVTGYGNIDGRLVFAYAQDVTVLGGSVGTIHGQKICHIMDEAIKVKAPLVALNDSGGGRLHEGFFASKGVAGMFYRNTAASGLIPQISVIMGPCAGGAVYSPAIISASVAIRWTTPKRRAIGSVMNRLVAVMIISSSPRARCRSSSALALGNTIGSILLARYCSRQSSSWVRR